MQTPRNFRTPYSMKRCANPDCENYVPVKGIRIYCDDSCRWSHTDDSRQSITRLRREHGLIASDDEMLALCARLARRPACLADRLDAAWHELQEFDTLLFRHGPIPPVRAEIGPRVAAMLLEFAVEPPSTSDEVWQYFQCRHIKVDLGVEELGDVPQLRHAVWKNAQFYFAINDPLNFARALMSYAHHWRLQNCFREARDWYTYSYNLLREYRGLRTAEYWLLFHSATRWHFRSRSETENLGKDELDRAEATLIDLAEKGNTPAARYETDCELTGLWGRGGRYRDRALQCHAHLEKLQKRYAFPEYGLLPSVRSKIHALLETKQQSDRDQAVYVFEAEFLPAYRVNTHFYYSKPVEAWKTELGLAFDPPQPVYGSAILTHLPRN